MHCARRMKNMKWIGLLFGVAACGGDLTASDVCNQMASSSCQRLYQCESPVQLAADGYPASEGDCAGFLEGKFACATATWASSCAPGETPADPSRWQACAEAIPFAACGDLGSSDFGLAACDGLCGDGVSMAPDGGSGGGPTYLSVTWTIDGTNDCAAYGASYVRLTTARVEGGFDESDLYDCTAFGAVISPLTSGHYTISGQLFDVNWYVIGGAGSGTIDATDGGTISVSLDL
jgi:hypothetical protein